MKENSIEEYIKSLEDFSNESVLYGSTVGMTLEKYKDLQLSTEHILSDYKSVLKENEELKEEKEQAWEEWNSLEQGSYETEQKLKQQIKESQKENEELKIKNNAIKRESEAYAENMIRLDNELNLEKEKSKYEWIRQNCLPQELVNKLYIPIQKVKDKIEELKQEKKKYGNCLIEMYEDELVNRDIEILQELLERRK